MLTLVATTFSQVSPDICEGIKDLKNASTSTIKYPNKHGWYGRSGTWTHPSNGPMSSAGGQFDPNPFVSQPRTYSKGRSCQSLVSDTYCVQSKGKANCAEFYTEEVLTSIKNKLAGGGYNCFSRHERTYWHQYTGETGCKKNGNCVELFNDPDHPWLTTSRYLAPWGHQASVYTAEAIKALGLNNTVNTATSSPFPRCLQNLKHLFPEATADEQLMYTGSVLENIKRKGLCETRMNSTADQIKSALVDNAESSFLAFELIFDGLRKLAGTPPPAGKNNFYNTHGFNMKGAFGQQIDEGYMMCFKPNDVAYPLQNRQHDICSCDVCPQPVVDFTGVKEFGLDFIVSSEAFPLMDELSKATPRDSAAKYADGVLESSEVATNAFAKLLALQNGVVSSTKVVTTADTTKYHLHTFAHVNGGYRDAISPNSLETVHVPLRNVLENSVTSPAQFAVVKAIVDAGDNGDDVDYACTMTTDEEIALKGALAKCYTHGAEPSWYWGGKDKASINAQHAYTNPLTYGKIAYEGNPSWFSTPYESEYVNAAACLVKSGKVDASTLMTAMGCASEFKSCEDVKIGYQSSQCCGTDGTPVSLVGA